jgi:hypothetical protein
VGTFTNARNSFLQETATALKKITGSDPTAKQ